MNIFSEPHCFLLKKLLAAEVEFILVGGFAVNYHGYNRTTGDMDVWLQPSNENKSKLLPVLAELDITDEDIKALGDMDFSKHVVFSLWEPPFRVDFLTYISGVQYAEAKPLVVMADIDGLVIPFLHLNHLIISKLSTGRTQDKADVEELQRIRSLSGKK